jgi:hypothetical protein
MKAQRVPAPQTEETVGVYPPVFFPPAPLILRKTERDADSARPKFIFYRSAPPLNLSNPLHLS